MKTNVRVMSVVAAGCLLAAANGRAELIDRGLTTVDTDTGLEWLDIDQTVNVSPRDINVDGYGGLAADGWVHATVEQIAELFDHAGMPPPHDGTLTSGRFAAASRLVDLLGVTGGSAGDRFIQAFSGTRASPGGPPFIFHTPTVLVAYTGVAGASVPGPGVPSTVRNPTIGNFLVRPAGPLSIEVVIDVKPGSMPNAINPRSKGLIPVAILTADEFDAPAMVDPRTVIFGPAGAGMAHSWPHIEDVDGDGDLDLVLHFPTPATGISCGETEVFLTGETYDGMVIEGSDTIVTVGCGK
jgi:hypothetical protein